MHCVAGDGLGILAAALIASLLRLPRAADIALEYALGFGFGWSIFQSLAMRGMAGGYYKRSLSITFFPELLSMNFLMAGMVPMMMFGMKRVPAAHSPFRPEFWFIMSMALLVGFITAYPMNWWLVSHHMKHGMITVRTEHESEDEARGNNEHVHHAPSERADADHPESTPTTERAGMPVSTSVLTWMTILSWVIFGLGLPVATIFGGM